MIPPRAGAVVLLALLARPARAETPDGRPVAQLSGIAGYQLTSTVYTNGGSIGIDGAGTYGALLALALHPEVDFELLWTISSTQARFVSATPGAPSAFPSPLMINYFQLGVTKSVRTGMVESFGEATAGLVLLSPTPVRLTSGDTLAVTSTVQFSFTLAAGLRIRFVEQLALVLEARLLAPVYISGGAFFAGGGGAVLAVSAGIPCVQGAFSGGLTFSF